MSPAHIRWTYLLKDESRRSFAGYLKSPLTEDQCIDFFTQIRDGTDWKQPKNPKGGLMPRLTSWMVSKGCSCTYRYGSFEVKPQEFPKWMVDLMHAVMPSCGFAKMADWPDSCNLNFYEDGGSSVAWHSDDERLFQGKFQDIVIISLSLGATRKFELRLNWPEEGERRVQRMVLGSGDLMTMEGMTQKHLQHRVPRENNVEDQRINLTWRWIVRHTPKCPRGRCRG